MASRVVSMASFRSTREDPPVLGAAGRAHVVWMRRRNLARSTIETRALVLGTVARVAGPLLDQTAEALQAVLDARGMSAATRNVWISHLSAFYRWAIDEGLLERSPMTRVARAKAPHRLPRPIAEHDLRVALAQARPKMRAWVTLGAYAGLRCVEIAQLRPEHIGDGTIRVENSKGGRSRVVPAHVRVVEALAACGGPRWESTAASVSVLISRHLRACGVPATAHQLRHRFACQVYEATGDIHVVAELLGHASVSTTQVYAAISSRRRSAAVALIA